MCDWRLTHALRTASIIAVLYALLVAYLVPSFVLMLWLDIVGGAVIALYFVTRGML